MEEIFGKKRNIHPELLLSNNQIDNLVDYKNTNNQEENCSYEDVSDQNRNNDSLSIGIKKIKQLSAPNKRQVIQKKQVPIIEKMRIDRKTYYEEKLKIEMMKLEEVKKRNRLIEERNLILREKKCNCQMESCV